MKPVGLVAPDTTQSEICCCDLSNPAAATLVVLLESDHVSTKNGSLELQPLQAPHQQQLLRITSSSGTHVDPTASRSILAPSQPTHCTSSPPELAVNRVAVAVTSPGDRALVDLIPMEIVEAHQHLLLSPYDTPLIGPAIEISDGGRQEQQQQAREAQSDDWAFGGSTSDNEYYREDAELTPTRRRFDVKSLKIAVVDDETATTWAGVYRRGGSHHSFHSSRPSTDTPDPRSHPCAASAATATSVSVSDPFSLGFSLRQQKTFSADHQRGGGGGASCAVVPASGGEDSYLSQSLSWSNHGGGSFCSAPLDETLMTVTAFRRDLNEAEQRFRVAMDKLRTRSSALHEASSEASHASTQHGHTFLKMLAVEAHRQNPGKVTPEKLTSLHRLIDERLSKPANALSELSHHDEQQDDRVAAASAPVGNHGAYEQSVIHHGDHHHSLAVVLATEQLFFPHSPTTTPPEADHANETPSE
jgi:hypothetical protein